jgi:hypothetical protein
MHCVGRTRDFLSVKLGVLYSNYWPSNLQLATDFPLVERESANSDPPPPPFVEKGTFPPVSLSCLLSTRVRFLLAFQIHVWPIPNLPLAQPVRSFSQMLKRKKIVDPVISNIHSKQFTENLYSSDKTETELRLCIFVNCFKTAVTT